MIRAAAVAVLVLLATGCGATRTQTVTVPAPAPPVPPRAAEPPAAPPTTRAPAGRVVPVGAKPEGVAVDPSSGRVAVAVQDPGRLVLLDGATGRRVRSVALPGTARHVALARAGGPFLVPVETANVLEQVPVGDGPIVSTRVGDHPHDAAQLGDAAYTVDEFGSTLSEVRGGRLRRQVPVDAQPGGVAAVGDTLAVTAVRAYTVEQYDRADLRGQGAQSAGSGPSHVVADAAGRLYIADTRGQALIVYRTRPRLRFSARIALGGSPLGLAVDDRRGRIWVTLAQRNLLVGLSLGDRPAILRRVPTVRQPDSDAVDTATGRVFIASRTDGTLQLFDP